jgi:hypothetical protein
MPKYWPTPTNPADPAPAVTQTMDALFAWAYVASFAAWLPFWAAALTVKEASPAAPSPVDARRAK